MENLTKLLYKKKMSRPNKEYQFIKEYTRIIGNKMRYGWTRNTPPNKDRYWREKFNRLLNRHTKNLIKTFQNLIKKDPAYKPLFNKYMEVYRHKLSTRDKNYQLIKKFNNPETEYNPNLKDKYKQLATKYKEELKRKNKLKRDIQKFNIDIEPFKKIDYQNKNKWKNVISKYIAEFPSGKYKIFSNLIRDIYKSLGNLLKIKLKLMKNFKISYRIELVLMDMEYVTYLNYINQTGNILINNIDDINEFLNNLLSNILTKYDKLNFEKSGLKLVSIEYFKITFIKNKVIRGSSYKELPLKIKNKKCIINPKNHKDNECFKWCLYIDHYKLKDNPERISKYKGKKLPYNFNGIRYPTTIKDIKQFEKNNRGISINIYSYDDINENSYIIYKSKSITKESRVINLFLYKEHFSYIKNFHRFLNSANTSYNRCPKCFMTFRDKTNYNLHCLECDGEFTANIEYPKENKKILEFKNNKNTNFFPVVGYSDFESVLVDINESSKNKKTKFTKKHNPVGYKIAINVKINYITDEKKLEILNKFMDRGFPHYKNLNYKKINNKEFIITAGFTGNKWKYNYLNDLKTIENFINKYVINLDNRIRIPLFYHNLKYDQIAIFHSLEEHIEHEDFKDFLGNTDFKIIPKSNNEFVAFNIGRYTIKDSIRFLPSSLSNLISNLDYNDKIFLKTIIKDLHVNIRNKLNYILLVNLINDRETDKNDIEIINSIFNRKRLKKFEYILLNPSTDIKPNHSKLLNDLLDKLPNHIKNQLNYIFSKGQFPYEWFNDLSKLEYEGLPKYDDWYDNLNNSIISKKEYKKLTSIFEVLGMKNFKDWYNLYLEVDVLGLMDVFENFRNLAKISYGLDPVYYYTLPGFSKDCQLKFSNMNVELITDYNKIIYETLERGIRGGLSQISTRHSKANNKYMKNYNPNKESKYIIYLDANNLYGWSMSQKLPITNHILLKNSRLKTEKEILFSIQEGSKKQKKIRDLIFKKFKNVNRYNDYKIKQLQKYNIKLEKKLEKDLNDFEEDGIMTSISINENKIQELKKINENINTHIKSIYKTNFNSYTDYITFIKDKLNENLIFEVDLIYPEELHDRHNLYPLAPEKLGIGENDLSNKNKEYLDMINEDTEGNKIRLNKEKNIKLLSTLTNKKNYITLDRNLSFYMEQGLIVDKVYKIISSNSDYYLKDYIAFNTNKRKEAKNDFEKDFYKLLNNSVFGKTMENKRNRGNIRIIKDIKKLENALSQPTFKNIYYVGKNFIQIETHKKKVKLDTPLFLGFSILELSKLLMYKFYYEVLQPKYGDRMKLLFTDTDSLALEIKTDDIYEDMKQDEDLYDFSNYDEKHFLYSKKNKKVLGKMKDEAKGKIITEFIGLKSKCYIYNIEDGTKEELEKAKKHKGIKKKIVRSQIEIKDFTEALYNCKTQSYKIRSFKMDKHVTVTQEQSKRGLNPFDDKRYILDDHINTLSYGHYQIKNKFSELDKQKKKQKIIDNIKELPEVIKDKPKNDKNEVIKSVKIGWITEKTVKKKNNIYNYIVAYYYVNNKRKEKSFRYNETNKEEQLELANEFFKYVKEFKVPKKSNKKNSNNNNNN